MNSHEIIPNNDSSSLEPTGSNHTASNSVEPIKPKSAAEINKAIKAQQASPPSQPEQRNSPPPLQRTKLNMRANKPSKGGLGPVQQVGLAFERGERKIKNRPPEFSFPEKNVDEPEVAKSEKIGERIPIHPAVDIPLPMAMAFIIDENSSVDAPHNTARLEIAELMAENTWLEIRTLYDLRRRVDLYIRATTNTKDHIESSARIEDRNIPALKASIAELKTYIEQNPSREYEEVLRVIESGDPIITHIGVINSALINFDTIVSGYKSDLRKGILKLPRRPGGVFNKIEEGLGFFLAHLHHIPFFSKRGYDEYQAAQKNTTDTVSRLSASILHVPFTSVQHPRKQVSPPIYWGGDTANSRVDGVYEAIEWLEGLPSPKQIEKIYAPWEKFFAAFDQEAPTAENFPMDRSKLIFSSRDRTDYRSEVAERKRRELAGFYFQIFPHLLAQAFPADSEQLGGTPPTASEFISWFAKRGIALAYLERRDSEEIYLDKIDDVRDKLLEDIPAPTIIVSLKEVLNFFTKSEKDGGLLSEYVNNGNIDMPYIASEYARLHLVIENLANNQFEDWRQQLTADTKSVLDTLIQTFLEKGWITKQQSIIKNVLVFNPDAPDHLSLGQLAEMCGAQLPDAKERFCNFFKTALQKNKRFIKSAYVDQDKLLEIVPQIEASPIWTFTVDNPQRKKHRIRLCRPLLGRGAPFLKTVDLPEENAEIELSSYSTKVLPLDGEDWGSVKEHYELFEEGMRAMRRGILFAQSSPDPEMLAPSSLEEIKRHEDFCQRMIDSCDSAIERAEGNPSTTADEEMDELLREKDSFLQQKMQWQQEREQYDPNRLLSSDFVDSELLTKWARPLISSYILYLISAPDVIIPDRPDRKGKIRVSNQKDGGFRLVTTAKSVALVLLEQKIDAVDALQWPKWSDIEAILLEVGRIVDTYNEELQKFEDFDEKNQAQASEPQQLISQAGGVLFDEYGHPVVNTEEHDERLMLTTNPSESITSGTSSFGEIYMQSEDGAEQRPAYSSYEQALQHFSDQELLDEHELLGQHLLARDSRLKRFLKRIFFKKSKGEYERTAQVGSKILDRSKTYIELQQEIPKKLELIQTEIARRKMQSTETI